MRGERRALCALLTDCPKAEQLTSDSSPPCRLKETTGSLTMELEGGSDVEPLTQLPSDFQGQDLLSLAAAKVPAMP